MRLYPAQYSALLLALISTSASIAQQNPGLSGVPPLRLTSTLVILDVTVLDRDGRPVVTGLAKSDFTVTEDNKAQRIVSFEAPEMHVASAKTDEDNPEGRAPVTIFVLDRLNSTMDEFSRIRDAVHAFLAAQPPQLNSPAELMVTGNDSFEMAQGYTRNRDDLLFALDRVQPAIPFKLMKSDFIGERAKQSIDALQQIAVQNLGVAGRKNVFWMGPGGPTISAAIAGPAIEPWKMYLRAAANLLVNARISLFVIYPSLKVETGSISAGSISTFDEGAHVSNASPFTGDVNFGLFARETGGSLFFNRNDLQQELSQSEQFGTHYYTLAYKPGNSEPDGKFRRIHLSLRDGNLRAVTKEGYFASDKNVPFDARQETVLHITEAARSGLAFKALEMKVSDVVRHPEARTTQFTVSVKAKNLGWLPADDGRKTAYLTMAMVSLSGNKNVLASKFEKVVLWSTAADPNQLSEEVRVRLTAQLPSRTQNVRIVLESSEGGRMGTVDLDRKAIDAAPAMPAHEPQAGASQPNQEHPLLR